MTAPHPPVKRGHRVHPDVAAMATAYNGGAGIREVALAAGVSFGTARQRLLDAGVELRTSGHEPVPLDGPTLKGAYDAGALIADLAAGANVSEATVRRALVAAGTVFRPRGSGPRRPRKAAATPAQAEDIATRYRAGESLTALERAHGLSTTAVRRALMDAGVELRDTTTPRTGKGDG